MQLSEINAPQHRQAQPDVSMPQHDDETAGSENRALVALGPWPDRRPHPTGHPYAPFLAQLVATKEQHPQTRERRRADPNDASAAYRAAAALKT